MVEMFGYDQKDFNTDAEGWFLCKLHHFMDKIHEDDKLRVELKIKACLNDGVPYRITYRVVQREGVEFLLIQAAGDIFNDNSGKPERLVGVCISLEKEIVDAR